MKTDTFIIIVSYNGMPWLSKCLSSCEPYQVIVVDNNSSDGSVAYIKKEFPNIIILQQDSNLGFGSANNIGITYALKKGAEYVFLLNQDAYLEKNTIEELVKVHKIDAEFGILSPIHLNGEGSKLDNNFRNYIAENIKLRQDILKQEFSEQVFEVPFVNAAAWLLPKTTLDKIGGFDPIFFHLGEDLNYCQRIIYHNLKIGVVPKAYVKHDREFRLKKKHKTKKENLSYFERKLKVRWANINNEIKNSIIKQNLDILRTIIKLSIKLMFVDIIFNIKKLYLLNKVLPEIINSRKKNKKVGSHYLRL